MIHLVLTIAFLSNTIIVIVGSLVATVGVHRAMRSGDMEYAARLVHARRFYLLGVIVSICIFFYIIVTMGVTGQYQHV